MMNPEATDIDLKENLQAALNDGSFGKETYQMDAVRREVFFQFTRYFSGVAGSGTISFYVENTSTDRSITLVAPAVQTDGTARLQLIRNPSSYGTTNSTTETIYNLHSDNSGTSEVNARSGSGVSISGGNIIDESIIPGGGATGTKVGGTSRAGIITFLQPGDSLVVRATNRSGSTSDFAGTLGFIQEESGVL